MRRYILYHIIIILIGLGVSLSVSANNYTFKSINLTNGISDLLVNAIYKDKEGFVWLGTNTSLDRYDGVSIRQFPFEGTDLKKKKVNVIVEDSQSVLWIGNNGGLWRLSSVFELPERIFAEKIDCPVYSIYVDDSLFYIGTEKGLFIYENGQVRQKLLHENIFSSANKVHGIEKDESGNLWLATAEGLCQYNITSDTFSFYHSQRNPDGKDYFQNITRIDDTLYLGTPNQGIFSFDIIHHTFERFVHVGNNIISALSSDGKENIYVGTDGNGVHFLSHKEKKITRTITHNARDKNSIRSNSVYSLLVDREGIVWIGFYQAGVDYSLYQNGLFHTYAMPPHFDTAGLTVRSFFIDGSVKLIGTRDGLYYIDEESKKVLFYEIPQLRANLILSITAYQDKYYIGTYGGGLSVLDAKTLRLSNFKGSDDDVFHNGHIFCLKECSDNMLWMGTSAGVYAYDISKNQIRHFDHTNSQIPEGNTYYIHFDSTGKGWICTDNGLSIYDPASGSIRSNIFPENFFNNEKIRFVFEDENKMLYFLLDRGGMLTTDLSMSICERYPIHELLHGTAYSTILQDEEGWFWLGSDDGLIRISQDREDFYTFNFTDGIAGNIFMNASYKDEDGVLWFSNNNGLLYVDPNQVDSLKQNPYPIVFTGLLVNGENVSYQKAHIAEKNDLLKLDDKENNITIRFVNLSYGNHTSAVYQYRMDGVDSDWQLLYGENEMSYYDLKPGKYQFNVRIPGNERSQVSINIRIGSWFSYGQYWLTACVVILIISLLIYLLYRSRRIIYSQIIRKKKEEVYEVDNIPENTPAEAKYKMNRLSEEECKELYAKLQLYMEQEKPYSNPDLKLVDLAKAIGVPSFSLSYFFSQYLHLSYYDYINQFRIEKFKQIVGNPEYKKYTLSSLATICGFNSRSSFFRSFKKTTGITPSEYVQKLGMPDKE